LSSLGAHYTLRRPLTSIYPATSHVITMPGHRLPALVGDCSR
jgi:hypothetical protein